MLLTHYVIGYLILIRASTDLFFFYCTLYAAYRFEVCKLLVAELGDVIESPAATCRRVQRVIDEHTHVFRYAYLWCMQMLFREGYVVVRCVCLATSNHMFMHMQCTHSGSAVCARAPLSGSYFSRWPASLRRWWWR